MNIWLHVAILKGNYHKPASSFVFDHFFSNHLLHFYYSYTPSQSDIVLYGALKNVPTKYSHALRWYNHIKSYQSEKDKLPGVKKSLQDFGVTGSGACAKTAAKKDDDDDDIDLFGSDDEVDEEADKAREERLKAYAEKKSKSMVFVCN